MDTEPDDVVVGSVCVCVGAETTPSTTELPWPIASYDGRCWLDDARQCERGGASRYRVHYVSSSRQPSSRMRSDRRSERSCLLRTPMRSEAGMTSRDEVTSIRDRVDRWGGSRAVSFRARGRRCLRHSRDHTRHTHRTLRARAAERDTFGSVRTTGISCSG